MRDRKTGRIIWYLFSAVLIKWGVEIAVATFALSCGLRSNMGIGAVSSIITIPMIVWIYRKDQGRYEKQQESWWKYKAASRYGMWLVMIVGAVTACVAMNDIVMLMNMQRISQVYQSTEQIIYSAPRWLQLAGAGILAPVAEELVYRGMIYRRMRESLTAVQAGLYPFCSVSVMEICHRDFMQWYSDFCLPAFMRNSGILQLRSCSILL